MGLRERGTWQGKKPASAAVVEQTLSVLLLMAFSHLFRDPVCMETFAEIPLWKRLYH